MVEFPIFEELKNFIYVNIEYILLIISPLTAIILYLTDKINKRIEASHKILDKINNDLLLLNTKFNKFELDISLEIERLKAKHK